MLLAYITVCTIAEIGGRTVLEKSTLPIIFEGGPIFERLQYVAVNSTLSRTIIWD